MERVQLSVSLREGHGKGVARKIRAKGAVPGIIYGKGMENILIEVNPKEVLSAFSGSAGMNAVLDLEVPKQGKIVAMLKDYQADNITRKFTHLDFVKLDLTKEIRVDVPIHIMGKAEGVKEGGILEVIRRELSVVCLPTNIPQKIEVEVTSLKIGQSIHIDDLKLPQGIEVPHDQNFAIVAVVAPQAEEVAAAAPAEGAPAEPEVLTAKKPAEGEEEKKADKK
ncbi:MAG: 50S ribosomal protein L25/general stress protein Ctc [bacterium]